MKSKKKKKNHKMVNRPPGTIYYRGEKQSTSTSLEVISYNKDFYNKIQTQNIEESTQFEGTDKITWINVNGLNNASDLEKIGKQFGLHSLTVEDVSNTTHRPKIDEFDNYLFIILKMLHFKNGEDLLFEQVSIVMGKDYVITFQEADGDVFDELRERIASDKGRIRSLGADYLMYSIIDAVVDNYLAVVEAFGDRIEELEEKVFEEESDSNLTANIIQGLKREILKIRRSVYPVREVISHLDKTDHHLIDIKTHNFIRDLFDHIIHVNESIELYREMVWSLLDMYMSIISNKMNEVMKMLTIIATIFIPLTFIAGIYGMNFDNMPELHYKYSYFILLGVMAIIFLCMVYYFRRKKWL